MDYKSFLIYGSCLLLMILFAYLYTYFEKSDKCFCNIKVRLICKLLLILVPTILAGIRYNVGTDFLTYIKMYDNLKGIECIDYFTKYAAIFDIEPSFYIISRFAYLFFDSVKVVFYIYELIIVIFVVSALERFNVRKMLPLSIYIFFLYFIPISFNLIRHTAALAIIFYALSYFYEEKYFKFIIYVFLATLFHKTAIIFFLVLFFIPSKNEKINTMKIKIYYIMIVLSPLILNITMRFIKYIPFLSSYFEKYNVNFNNSGFGFLIFILPTMLPIIYMWKKGEKQNIIQSTMNVYLLTIPLSYLGYYLSWAGRMADYTWLLEIVLLPWLLTKQNQKEKKYILLYFILFYLFYYIYMYMFLGNNEIFPYQVW